MDGLVVWEQHPVGHGGFHTGQATTNAGQPFTWIYDCGSRSKRTLRKRLKAWASMTPGAIDWLFISHFDSDHVNGLDDLFRLKTIDAVMLPYVNETQVTQALSEIVLDRSAPAWLVRLIADPVGWFGARRVKRLYFLQAGEPGELGGLEAAEPIPRAPRDGEEPRWKSTVSPPPRQVAGSGTSQDPDVFVVPHGGCRIRASDGHLMLRLEPYRAPFAPGSHALLMSHFVGVAGITPSGPFGLGNFAYALARAARTSKGRRAIQAGYAAAIGSSNRASLSLLSVLEDDRTAATQGAVLYRGEMPIRVRKGATAWGSTGDAELLDPVDLAHFAARYGTDLELLEVLSLPHHGSDLNSDRAFQALNRAALLTAQVKAGGSAHHPGADVSRYAGGRMARVTSNDITGVRLVGWSRALRP